MFVRLGATTTLAIILCAGAPGGFESSSVFASVAQTTTPPALWTERLLATVPKGLSPRPSEVGEWIAVTQDLTRIAYVVGFQWRGVYREAMVFGNQRGPEFTDVYFPTLSPDGTRLAYIGLALERSTAGFPAYLALGESRIQVQIKDTSLSSNWAPVFSPDGRKLAFTAERQSGKYAIGVLDFGDGRAVISEASVTWGPEFRYTDPPRWSPDSTHVIYAAGRSETEWLLVTGTEAGPSFTDATGVTIRRDGMVAFKAKDAGRWFIVLAGERQAPFDEVTEPFFRADGTVVYGASDGGKHFVVMGQSKSDLPHATEGVVASADGRRVTDWYREVGSSRSRIVINGHAGPFFDNVRRPVIDPETGAYAYAGRSGFKFQVVTQRGASPTYDGILCQPRIREDGAAAGYVALIKDKLWWKVIQLRTEVPAAAGTPAAAAAPGTDGANPLLTARTVAVIGQTGKQISDRFIWNPDGARAKQKVEAVLVAWGRYDVVPHPEDADLVFVVTEFQKNLSWYKLANLVAEMRVFRGGQMPTADTPILWLGDASEGLKQPATKVAERFRDFVMKLPARPPDAPQGSAQKRLPSL